VPVPIGQQVLIWSAILRWFLFVYHFDWILVLINYCVFDLILIFGCDAAGNEFEIDFVCLFC